MTLESVFSALLIAYRARQDGIGIGISATTRAELRRLASTGWPLIVAGLSVSVYMRVDQIMLGQMLGDAGVGMFSAAVRISEAYYFFPVTVAQSVAPALTATYTRSAAEYERRFVQITRLLLWTGLAVAAVLAVFSRQIIVALYGPKYLDSAPVLAIHAWAGALVSLGVCGNLWLTNAGYFKFSMYQTLVGAAVNVGLNLTLIPRLGIIGAALATCAGQLASVMLTTAVMRETRRLFRLQLAALVPRLS
jgi:PST family polysaccharide transporter